MFELSFVNKTRFDKWNKKARHDSGLSLNPDLFTLEVSFSLFRLIILPEAYKNKLRWKV